MSVKPAGLDLMRQDFPPNQISKMCRSTKKDNPKGTCNRCGSYHGLPSIQLEYVGHAALTDRLLDADPSWAWEPMAVGDDGYPVIDSDGGMWIKLTVCGVTRYGYGDAQGKTGGDAMKERIGDALRNAAMRFGAALDLWHKGDLHVDDDDKPEQEKPEPPKEESAKNTYHERTEAALVALFGTDRKAMEDKVEELSTFVTNKGKPDEKTVIGKRDYRKLSDKALPVLCHALEKLVPKENLIAPEKQREHISRDQGNAINEKNKLAHIPPEKFLEAFGIKKMSELYVDQLADVQLWIDNNSDVPLFGE